MMVSEKEELANCGISAIKPAFPSCDYCIVFSTNDNYIALTAVAIQSLADHASTESFYDILVLHAGINNEHIENFTQHWHGKDNLRIRLVDVAPIFQTVQFYTHTADRPNISKETYYRLAIPWILSSDYNKALYLDGDIIIRHDVAPIFNMNLGNSLLAAVRDYWGICNCYKENNKVKTYRLSIGLNDIDNYAIAATMLFNLKQWRHRFSLNQVISLSTSRQWRQHDQDVINVLCQHNITHLTPNWGMMEDCGGNHHLPGNLRRELEAVNDPIIVHFGGGGKPYLEDYLEYDLEFWKYADETPYIADLMGRIQSSEYRNYVACSINKEGIMPIVTADGKKELYYKGVALGLQGQGWQHVDVVRINNQVLHLEGSVFFFDSHNNAEIVLSLSVNGCLVKPVCGYQEKTKGKRLTNVSCGHTFVFDVPLSKSDKKYLVRLKAAIIGKEIPLSTIYYQPSAELTGKFANEYYTNDGWTIRTDNKGDSLIVTKNAHFSFLWSECKYLFELFKSKSPSAKKAIVVRLLARSLKFLQWRPIWIVSDGLELADDNGEVFYKYLKENRKSEVRAYFLLSPNSSDYDRMRHLGGVIAPYSWRHKILELIAEWNISSQFSRHALNDVYYRDIARKTRFAYMEHVVISNDNSMHLDKDIPKLDGLVTSTPKECHRILRGKCHYGDKQVWPTGLPRFDRLLDERLKIITFLPTWHRSFFSNKNLEIEVGKNLDGFEIVDYVSFYKNLFNDNVLRTIIRKYGYALRFMPPQNCRECIDVFQIPADEVYPADTSYLEIYKSSSLIVTDYSTSIYDFIYLRKPVVYCQFDAERFFSDQNSFDNNGFDYERDGFGEVTHSIQELIPVLESYLKTDCALHEPYKTRIEKEFPDREPTHCDRLYKTIREQGKY